MKKPGPLILHWPSFGAYHIARIKATQERLAGVGIQVIGMEIASRERDYTWSEPAGETGITRLTLFPGRVVENVPTRKLWKAINNFLNEQQPSAVAINGYSTKDALGMLGMCRLRKIPAILMSDSKKDDSPRRIFREYVKRVIVHQFDAGLCGGVPQREYVIDLGIQPNNIFIGYAAVDNIYFNSKSKQAQMNSERYRKLPGLEQEAPYFLASGRFLRRKNYDGLIRAYAGYRKIMSGLSKVTEPWRLVILGDGEERDTLERLKADLKVPDVSLPGFQRVEELPAYYGLARAFIHPPFQEQWGLVVNEAMASELPAIVSTRCGCFPDLISEGETGFGFDPNELDQLTSLMVRMTCGEIDGNTIGKNAWNRIDQFGLDRFATGMSQAYYAAISSCK